ncbi:MAG: hypothetical protein ABIK44_02335, partial [candidate division WOR-3 bacterium]
IAAGDIGAIGFYSNAYICDMAGLVMPKPKACGGVPNAVRVWQPDYLFLVACRDEAGALLSASEVAARYRPVARFSKTAQQNLFPGLDELHPRWLQDYILYQRLADSVP